MELFKITEQVEAMYGGADRTVRTEIVLLYFASVQVSFFVLNTIQLYEPRSIKSKGGFYTHVVFNSTYQVLTKFHKVCTKSLFSFRYKEESENTQYL